MSESQTPLVSVIIPVYNRESLVGETLDSVIAQTYQNWECIVVDDGSTDRTREVVQGYCDKDRRIKLFSRPNDRPKGANACRNYGFELSQGEFIKWFDSDDVMKPFLIQSQVETHWASDNFDAVICDWECFGQDSDDASEGFPLPKNRMPVRPLESFISSEFYFQTGAPLWSREYLNQSRVVFDETLARGQESDFHFQHLFLGLRTHWDSFVGFAVRRGHPNRIGSEYGKLLKSEISFLRYWEKVCDAIAKMNLSEELVVFAWRKRLFGLRRVKNFGFSYAYVGRCLAAWIALVRSSLSGKSKQVIPALIVLSLPSQMERVLLFVKRKVWG